MFPTTSSPGLRDPGCGGLRRRPALRRGRPGLRGRLHAHARAGGRKDLRLGLESPNEFELWQVSRIRTRSLFSNY